MRRTIAAWTVLVLATALSAPAALAQSSPISNCRYYVKTQADYEQGLPYCREAIVAEPDDAETRFLAAVCMAETGHLEEAWQSFSWLIERMDDKDKKVRKEAEKGEKQATYYFQGFFNKGLELDKAMETEAAKAEFLKATQIYPTKIEGYLNLGYTETKLGDLDGAIATFQKAIEIDPQSLNAQVFYWDALRQKLEALRMEEAPDSARIAEVKSLLEPTLLKVVELDPSRDGAFLELADLELEAGNNEKGLEYFRKAIEIAPDAVYNLFNIGGDFYMNDQYGPAIQAFQIFLDEINDPADANWQKAKEVQAWSYYYAEDWENAVDALKQVIEFKPDDKDNYAKLGLSYQKLGQSEEASKYFLKFQEMKDREIVGE
jgi:tetratricopeptide (TPR) repeat protein